MEPTVEEIVKKCSYVGMSGGLVHALQRSLYPDEVPIYAHNGLAKKDGKEMEALTLITSQRVLCCTRELIRKEINEIPILNVQGMQVEKGNKMIRRELHIEGLTEEIVVIGSPSDLKAIQLAIRLTREQLEQIKQEDGETIYVIENGVESEDDQAGFEQQIRALKRLLDDGLLTAEEYEAKKKQVLGL